MTQEFTIQQMSFETGLTSYTLRYYEKIGLILDVPRAGSSHRRYGASHLAVSYTHLTLPTILLV